MRANAKMADHPNLYNEEEFLTNTVRRSLTDTSLDAALELEEIIQGIRADAPMFSELVNLLKKPKKAYSANPTVSMLTDVRSAGLLRDVIRPPRGAGFQSRQEDASQISAHLDGFLKAITAGNVNLIKDAKQFCLKLNREFLAKDYEDLMSRQKHLRSNNSHNGC